MLPFVYKTGVDRYKTDRNNHAARVNVGKEASLTLLLICIKHRNTDRALKHLIKHPLLWLFVLQACTSSPEPAPSVNIGSLEQLAIATLRDRSYGSSLQIEKIIATDPHMTAIASYDSDGLRLYTRIDIPSSAPPLEGYPVVVFVHGWMGIEAAPSMTFYVDDDSNYDRMIDVYVDADFAVLTPGWRGHGTVDGVPADGIEFMQAWDNSSYLSPVFYAIDILNLLDSLDTLQEAEFDLENINMVSHSQGGDVALIALAIAGEGSGVKNEWSAASFWSGCFPSRDTQFHTYSPMEKTPEAFLSGDGSWNGTAVGADGQVNPNFVFGYPPDWIGTPNPDEWTWQKDVWSTRTVAELMQVRLQTMYDAINSQVADISDATYELRAGPDGSTAIVHDPRIAAALSRVDAFNMAEFLTEPVTLQYSDRDFYSFPEWNIALCERINSAGGECHDFEYAENTHSLGVSEHRWFSSEAAVPGFETAIQRDIELFRRAVSDRNTHAESDH
jgi:pimeloyl-ACP methyl ester carboxylesterase